MLSSIEQKIKAKIESAGAPLKDWDIKIYRGILTGYNEAFIISGQKKKEILDNCKTGDEREKTDQLIRPILRGRDIKRYGYDFCDLWLLNTHNGIKEKGIKPIDIEDYPAIKNHLDAYYNELSKRTDKGITPYNLRNCAYMDDFSRQKIVWGEISDTSNFALDSCDNYFVNNKCYLLSGSQLEYLVCFLNSPLAEYLFSKIATTTGVGTLQWSKFTIETLSVPLISEIQLIEFQEILSESISAPVDKSKINSRIYEICELTTEEINFIESR